MLRADACQLLPCCPLPAGGWLKLPGTRMPHRDLPPLKMPIFCGVVSVSLCLEVEGRQEGASPTHGRGLAP